MKRIPAVTDCGSLVDREFAIGAGRLVVAVCLASLFAIDPQRRPEGYKPARQLLAVKPTDTLVCPQSLQGTSFELD